MRDFSIKLRPLHPITNPRNLPTHQPVGITIRAISGVTVLQTQPDANIQIKNETYLLVRTLDWLSIASTFVLRAYDQCNPVVDIICHPNIALREGLVFEITPLTNPSQLYVVEFPPLEAHSEGIVIHTNLQEIFRQTDAFTVEFLALGNRLHSNSERRALISSTSTRSVNIVQPVQPPSPSIDQNIAPLPQGGPPQYGGTN